MTKGKCTATRILGMRTRKKETTTDREQSETRFAAVETHLTDFATAKTVFTSVP